MGIDSGYTHFDVPHPVPASGQGLWMLAGQWVVLGVGVEFPGGLTQDAGAERHEQFFQVSLPGPIRIA